MLEDRCYFNKYKQKITGELAPKLDITGERHILNGVSDLFDGLSDGEIHGFYGHSRRFTGKSGYWKRKNALEKEAIAHFFEAIGSEGEKLRAIKDYFPRAFEYFDKFVRENLEGGEK